MQVYKFEGKTEADILSDVKDSLNKKEDDLIIKFHEEKGSLFKSKRIEATIYIIDDLINFAKEKLLFLTELMGIDVKTEVKNRNKVITIKMYSNNNNILIGKNGKTIESLQILLKQMIYTKAGVYLNLQLDVEDYKENRNHRIEILAKNVAREVAKTKIEIKLDSMNSYERRIVHEVLNNWGDVYTESVGEEPNRCIIIKAKENN